MISKKDKKTAFELIKLMKEQRLKGVSVAEAASLCGKGDFFEIIKFLKYSDLIKSGVHPEYVLTKKGYRYTWYNHTFNYLKKRIIFLSILVGFIIQVFTIYKIISDNDLKEKKIEKLYKKIDDLETKINSCL